MQKKLRIFFVLFFFLLVYGMGIAQCPMCRMSLESNLDNGGTAGKTINAGILYMLAMPYILVGSIGYIWYKNKKKAEAEEEESKARLN